MARPQLDIDAEQVEKLAMLQCTLEEMAMFFDCDPKTISNRFSKEIRKGKETGKISLRRNMFRLSEKNTVMCIWLSKQYLGMREPKIEIKQLENESPLPQNISTEDLQAIEGILKKYEKK